MSATIGAAFRSSRPNECYLFVNGRYVILDYSTLEKYLISGPVEIAAGFPMFANTIFRNGIDSAFESEGNIAYFFSGNKCVKTDYAPRSGPAAARIIRGTTDISSMFPCLERTVFENGIDAALRFDGSNYALLFKENKCGVLEYNSSHLYDVKNISDRFKPFKGTVFEEGIDAAFTAYGGDEIFIFKGKHCARVNREGHFIGGITLIHDDWPTLHGII